MTDVDPAVTALSRALLPEADGLALGMAERIRTEIPLYRDGETVGDAELVASCSDNLRYVLGGLAGESIIGGEAPSRTGAARAEQGVPYAALLQAYRVGGRFIWELLVDRADPGVRDTLLLAAADIWAVTDELSSQVTDAYRSSLAERARRDGQMRATVLGSLLDDVTDAEQLWESAAMLNLPRQGELVVVAAECPMPGQEALPGIEDTLRRHNVPSAWRLDHDRQEGLVALRPGYRVPELLRMLGELAHGRVGLSALFTHVDQAHAARREARLSCAAVTPKSEGVTTYDQSELAVLLAGTPDSADEYARRVLGSVLALPADDRDALLETARVWLEEAGSSSAAAARLFLHRNTVRYRTHRLAELTGRELANPIGAAELHVALECARILELG